MTESEARAVIEVVLSADDFEEHGGSALLARLQVKLPERDWFLLAALEWPRRLSVPGAIITDDCDEE